MENFIEGIIMKIEIDLPEEVYLFFKARSIIKEEEIEKEIVEYLKREIKCLKDSSFKEAIC